MESTNCFFYVQQAIIYDFIFIPNPNINTMEYELKSVNVRCRQRKQPVNLILLVPLHPWRTLN